MLMEQNQGLIGRCRSQRNVLEKYDTSTGSIGCGTKMRSFLPCWFLKQWVACLVFTVLPLAQFGSSCMVAGLCYQQRVHQQRFFSYRETFTSSLVQLDSPLDCLANSGGSSSLGKTPGFFTRATVFSRAYPYRYRRRESPEWSGKSGP